MKPIFNKIIRLIIQKKYFLFYGSVLFLLLIKYYLISDLSVKSGEDFLATARFISSDSYDWFANGLRFFDSENISFRQPGYSVLIFILDKLQLFFLHNLLTSLALFLLVFSIVETLRHLKVNAIITILIGVMIFANGNIQTFASYALSDMFAVAIYAFSILLYVKGRLRLSFLMLGFSALFQYFAFIAAVPQFLHWFINFAKKNKSAVNLKVINSLIFNSLYYIFLTILPNLPWLLFRYIKFGDPLHSGVENFSLVVFHTSSLLFYTINSYSMFGLFMIIALLGLLLMIRKSNTIDYNLYYLLMFLAVFVFWILLYNWDDRRFLLYFIPVIFVAGGLLLNTLLIKTKYSLIILTALLIGSIYPTQYMFDDFFNSSRVPLIHSKIMEFSGISEEGGTRELDPQYKIVPIVKSKWENIPVLSQYIHWARMFKYRKDPNIIYQSYSKFIDDAVKEERYTKCIAIREGGFIFDWYIMNSILLIKEGETISQHNKNCDLNSNL